MAWPQTKEQPTRESEILYTHPVLQAARAFRAGSLTVTLPDGARLVFRGKEPGVRADLQVYDRQALDDIARHGDIGFGEGYALGLWDTSDLGALMGFLAENVGAIEAYINGTGFFKTLYMLKNRLRSNTSRGSRKNIHAHYDLGNNFYGLWLDGTMTYSCALFGGDPALSLEEAQKAKYRRILDRLAPAPADHILEIGCGWGGFMEEAARRGCRVTGLTISPAQAEFARARLAAAGLDGLTDVRLQDYRAGQEQYDHIVSIGMMEHVGEEFWPEYMHKISSALKPGGRAMIQSIMIREDLFDNYRKSSDFFREHIFPGGMLPCLPRFMSEAWKAGLRVNDVFRFGQDYALTAERWRANFDASLPELSAMGFSEEFIRKWRFYLAACAAMFRAGRIDVMQVELRHA